MDGGKYEKTTGSIWAKTEWWEVWEVSREGRRVQKLAQGHAVLKDLQYL